MSAVSPDTAVRAGCVTQTFIYLVLLLFALFYLLPLYVMGINPLKPSSKISGNMVAPRETRTLYAWRSAWSAAQIDGAGFFRIFWRIRLTVYGPITVVSFIWRLTNIWIDFLFGLSFRGTSQPTTAAVNYVLQSSTSASESNVHLPARSWQRYPPFSSTSSRIDTSCAALWQVR